MRPRGCSSHVSVSRDLERLDRWSDGDGESKVRVARREEERRGGTGDF